MFCLVDLIKRTVRVRLGHEQEEMKRMMVMAVGRVRVVTMLDVLELWVEVSVPYRHHAYALCCREGSPLIPNVNQNINRNSHFFHNPPDTYSSNKASSQN